MRGGEEDIGEDIGAGVSVLFDPRDAVTAPNAPDGAPQVASPRATDAARLDFDAVLEAFRAAGEESRLRVLTLLLQGELTVGDLARILGQSQPRVSRHVKVLIEAGLVRKRREGPWSILTLAEGSDAVAAIEGALTALGPRVGPLGRDRERLAELQAERYEAAQAYFRAHAATWSRDRALLADPERVEAEMRAMVGSARLERVVDLGSGVGDGLALFADQTREGVGVDVNHEMLAYARSRLRAQDNLRFRHGDLFHLADFDESADLAILHQVIRYLTDADGAVRAAARMLRPGGRLLITEFAPHDRSELLAEARHVRLGVSEGEMAAWLANAGLEPAATRRVEPALGADGEELAVTIWLAARSDAAAERFSGEKGVTG